MKFIDMEIPELDFKARSQAAALDCKDKTLTQQHMAEETNINTIVKRFGLTGKVPLAVRLPTAGDFTGVSDYQTALNAIMEADKSFEALPADIRKRFANDASEFVDFCSDPANIEELRKLGLAEPLPAPVVSIPKESMQTGTEPSAGGAI